MRWMTAGLAAVAVVFGVGCKPGVIPGTYVENTAENREIAGAVEKYRKALETRSSEAVLKLCSEEYFEDNGTADPSDDYDFKGLNQHLADDMARIKALRVSVRVLRVNVDGDRAWADYRFQIRSLVDYPSGAQWMTRTEDNRLTFRREARTWKIVAGL